MARLVHVLLLQLLLPFTEPVLDVFVKAEHDTVLTCDKVQDGQELCDMTTWLYINPKTSNTAVEFITLGKISSNFKYKDRFFLMENCSLVIKNVQIQDGLHFSCKQYSREGGRELSDVSKRLTVVSVEEHETGPNCYVSSPHRCSDIQVRWFYNNSEIRGSSITHEFLCGAVLVYQTSDYRQTKKDLFKCEITHNNKRRVYKLKSEKSPDGTESVDDRGTTEGSSGTLPGWWWWAVLVLVAVAALTITAVILIKRRRKKERPQENSDLPPTEPEDGVSYASVSYTKTKESRPVPRVSEEETVTYSSVRTPVSHNLTPVYASVRKH